MTPIPEVQVRNILKMSHGVSNYLYTVILLECQPLGFRCTVIQ